MEIELLQSTKLTLSIQDQVSKIYEQLNPNIVQRPLVQILQNENKVIVAVCREQEAVIGIALLATYTVISGHRGMVEDVVVDEAHRGKGIGRKLMQKLLEEAKYRNLDEVLLFTGHHRSAAINLYKSLGFTLRESGLYNLKL
ncbi:GNAT family N-acetyltransferase [Aggregatimonas sangjinii]|uniref:GNAT family N-acetyltransferase n=1 Tax=Aggregatimonas sangjinii TaxID=2583587 RepID=A0A5B7STI1_9FLAO|nr:GNAT family N-acetyltransferase [Aggregatimonas sangjinii]QCX00004.1 GNAT family N-acetyltransferase [Aggregatimonas sangjinii]